MTLSELLESKFRGDIRFRGAAYLQAERVAVVRVTAEHLFAVVRDGIEYHTQLSREGGELKMNCNCAAQPGKGKPAGSATCKHLWATVLAADAGQYISGSAKPGFVPPFRAESDELSFDDEEWDEDDERPSASRARIRAADGDDDDDHLVAATLAGAAIAGNTSSSARTVAREWEQRLVELRKTMQSPGSATANNAGRESQIFYELDLPASEEAGLLIIQTSVRQRRATGQWGKLKPLKLRPGRFDEVDDDEDRRILAHLAGGTPDRANGAGEAALAAHRYRVPYDLAVMLLPNICETGRIRFAGDEESPQQALIWDTGVPWELCLDLSHDEGKSVWRLAGSLRREGERKAIADPLLALPGGLIITREAIARLEDFDSFQWVTLLRQGVPLEAPEGDEQDLVDRLHDMPTLPRLELPEELRLQEVRLEPKPYLLIAAPGKGRWQHDRLKAEVLFQYDDRLVRGTSHEWAVVQRSANRCLVRHKTEEERLWSELQDGGFRRLLDHRRGQFDVEIPSRDVGRGVRQLMENGWQVRAEGKQVRQPGELKFQIKSGVDWFELHGDVEFEGQRVAFPELLAALQRGDGTIVLDDGSLGIVPEEWLKRYGMLGGLGVLEDEHLRFSTAQASLLDALLATRETVDYDARFIELRDRLANFEGVPGIEHPVGFVGELRPYQQEGVGWLGFLDQYAFGGCLADDMGLGKTIQMLAFLIDRKSRTDFNDPSLAVVPKSLMFNWRQEATKFAPELRVLEYTGLERAKQRDEFKNYDLILTTYGTLRRDYLTLKDLQFDYLILDEAQAIKNASSQVAKAVRLLNGRRRVALSGTPIENHLGDLCSIFEFLNPGLLGRSSLFRLHAADAKDVETRKLLAQGLRPFILRRTKQGVASELPEKIEQTVYCEMGPEQERLYGELREHYRDLLLGLIENEGIAKARFHVLEALLRLRQAACHPALLHKASDTDASAKLDVLCAQLEALLAEGHKALVFSQFTSMLAIVRKHLDERGIVYEYLDGQTRDRKSRVNRFQTDEACGVFLISLKAGGLGLNLTAADYVFILDPWWNPAVEAQAIDRAHRVGQTRRVVAYRLICRNTVEEKIAELQQHKRELADAILEQDGSLLQNLTAEDLQKLLS